MSGIPDIIEMWEESAERSYDDMIQDDGRLKCACGELFDPDEGCMISPHPYSMPACSKCFEEAMKEWDRQKKEREGSATQDT